MIKSIKTKREGLVGFLIKGTVNSFIQGVKLKQISDNFLFSIVNINHMQFLRELFRKDQQEKYSQTIERTLTKLRIAGNSELPHYFHDAIMEASSKNKHHSQLMTVLVKKIRNNSSVPVFVKTFTILFNILRRSGYDSKHLEQLELCKDMQLPQCQANSKDKLVKQLAICCMTYLGRVASIGDIYHRALSYKVSNIDAATLQTDLFRLLNVYSLLFPMLSHVTNTIGRYFKENYEFYIDFYRTMRSELFLGYTYMRYICSNFVQGYQKIDRSILAFFLDTTPEVEVLCDQMEDFFLNKHFKNEKLGKRLYFREEDIQELRYYLGQDGQFGKEKEEDLVRTADSQIFNTGKNKVEEFTFSG